MIQPINYSLKETFSYKEVAALTLFKEPTIRGYAGARENKINIVKVDGKPRVTSKDLLRLFEDARKRFSDNEKELKRLEKNYRLAFAFEEKIEFPWDCNYNKVIHCYIQGDKEWTDKICSISELKFGAVITLDELPKLTIEDYITSRHDIGYAISPHFEKYRKQLGIKIKRRKVGSKIGIVLDEDSIKCIQYSKQMVRDYHRDRNYYRRRQKKVHLTKKNVHKGKDEISKLEKRLKSSKKFTSFTRVCEYLFKKYPLTMEGVQSKHLGNRSVIVFLKHLNIKEDEFRIGARDAYLSLKGVKKVIKYVEDIHTYRKGIHDDFDTFEFRIKKNPSLLEEVINKEITS